MNIHFQDTILIRGVETDVHVAGMIEPGEKGYMYDRNGDGYPGSDPYVDCFTVKSLDGRDLDDDLSEQQKEEIAKAVMSYAADNPNPADEPWERERDDA